MAVGQVAAAADEWIVFECVIARQESSFAAAQQGEHLVMVLN
jgi:hypothetical protein